MRRGALIRELDEMIEQGTGICESSDLSVEERRLLENIYRTSYRRRIPLITPPGTSDTLFRIGFIVIMGWLLVTAWRWLIVVDAFPQRDDSICITIEVEDKDGVSANEC
jgi:hypothetical protein